MSRRFVRAVATGFGIGYAPFAPGTAGTAVAIPLYLMFSPLSWPLYLLSVAALACLACLVSGEAERLFRRKDAQPIVIDEIVGFLCTMFLVAPTALHILLGFVLFRVFDIVKWWPAEWCQRRLPGGYGVVGDDVAAGLQACLVLQAAVRLGGI